MRQLFIMVKKMEQIKVIRKRDRTIGRFEVVNRDPWFLLQISDDSLESDISTGDMLIRYSDTKKGKKRKIIGINIDDNGRYLYLSILAPLPISSPKPNAPYLKYEDKVNNSILEYRPGTTVLGGSDSGFYDAEGIILDAFHTGGDPKKFEDWVYRVIAPAHFRDLTTLWVTDADLGFPISGPSQIIGLPDKLSRNINSMLEKGEKELLKYFLSHPKKIDYLRPKQFEKLVTAIYQNMGFDVQPLGEWNQPDGGIDIFAMCKTDANTDYRIAIQCKTSKNNISAKPIRELVGVLDANKAHQGIVATTSKFTLPAIKEVEGNYWRITLQDRDELIKRMLSIVLPDLDL
jgi:Restriction endonuclease